MPESIAYQLRQRKTKLKHKNCGGIITENWNDPYEFSGEDAKIFGKKVPKYICQKCKKEILGDSEIELEQDKGE